MGDNRDRGIESSRPDPRDAGYVPAPDLLPGFPGAQLAKPKAAKGQRPRRRWEDGTRIYEWDYRHGRVEIYDRRGRHLGKFDPVSGRRLKGPNPNYTVVP